MAKPDFAHTALKVGDVDLVDTRLFGEIDLPPTLLFSEFPDSFTKLGANINRHSSSIDLVEALYLVDALSGEGRGRSGGLPSAGDTWSGLASDIEDQEGRPGVILRQKFDEIFSQGTHRARALCSA